MERRADTGSRLEPGSLPAATADSKAWLAIRRVLGRWVSRVGVRTVEDAQRTLPAVVRRGELALPPPLSKNGDWKLTAATSLAPVPAAGTGLRESDLLPAATLAAGNYALPLPEVSAMPIAALELRTDNAALEWPATITRLPDTFLRLPVSPVRTQLIPLLPLPKTAPLRNWTVQLPSTRSIRPPRVPAPSVRWGGDSVLRRMPLTRRGRAIQDKAMEDAAGRRRLAETVQLGPEEVTLLGVYPDVPILAVERIVVEDEGRQLRLWLKPDVLRSRSGSHRITLLVGRQISNGKMLQAAL